MPRLNWNSRDNPIRFGGAFWAPPFRGLLVRDARRDGETLLAEQREAGVPLDAPDANVLTLRLADIDDVDTGRLGGGQTGDTMLARAVVEGACENRGADAARRTLRLGRRNPVVTEDWNAEVDG